MGNLGSCVFSCKRSIRINRVNCAIAIYIFDLDTLSFLEVNQAAIECYGYTREEFLLMTLKDFRPAEDIPIVLNYFEQTEQPYNQDGEWRHLLKNGELMFVEITSHAVTFNGRIAKPLWR